MLQTTDRQTTASFADDNAAKQQNNRSLMSAVMSVSLTLTKRAGQFVA